MTAITMTGAHFDFLSLAQNIATGAAATQTAPSASALASVFSKPAAAAKLLAAMSTSTSTGDRALRSAARKLEASAAMLDDGADAIVALLSHQLKMSDVSVSLAKQRFDLKLIDIKQRTEERIEKIHERMEAQKSAAKWGLLGKIFKAIAAAVSAASSVFTGGVGAVAAGLLVASLVVSVAAKGKAGMIVSAALGIAGALMSLGSSAADAAGMLAKTAAKIAKTVSSAAGVAQGVSAIAQGVERKDALDASADLAELEAILMQLRTNVAEALDKTREALDAQRSAIEQTVDTLKANASIGRMALSGRTA